MWNLSILIIFLSWKLDHLSQRHVTCSQSLWVSQRRKWLVNHSLSFFLLYLHVCVFVVLSWIDSVVQFYGLGRSDTLKFAAFFLNSHFKDVQWDKDSEIIWLFDVFFLFRIQKLNRSYKKIFSRWNFPYKFCYKNSCRFCRTGLPSDITVVVDDVKFHLHKVYSFFITHHDALLSSWVLYPIAVLSF